MGYVTNVSEEDPEDLYFRTKYANLKSIVTDLLTCLLELINDYV